MKATLIDFNTKKEINAPGTYIYCPEMGQKEPAHQIKAHLGYSGKWILYTTLELKGQGIKADGTDSKGNNRYKVTDRAFNKLETLYSIAFESFLD